MLGQTGLWVTFGAIMTAALIIDLGLLHRKARAVSIKEAAWTSIAWVSLAVAFASCIAFASGRERALQFVTGYIVEESLSADNMFVFLLIFQYFRLPAAQQARVLHWGILGAVIMRFVFIFAGISLINAFHWTIYVFGAIVVITGLRMALRGPEVVRPEDNLVLRTLQRFMPDALRVTPVLATLLVIESSDLIFALDSIPAVLAITRDTFVVYTSNIFAIMGLRALFFLLAGLMGMFTYMKAGISLILIFVGIKMLASGFLQISTGLSLVVIAGILAASIAASVLPGPKKA